MVLSELLDTVLSFGCAGTKPEPWEDSLFRFFSYMVCGGMVKK